MRKFRDAFLRLLALIVSTGTTGMEFQSSTTLLVCAAFMFCPGMGLSVFIPYQRELLSLAPESTWATACFVVGLAQALSSFQRVSRMRMISAFLAASVFGSFAVAAAMASPMSFFVLALTGVAGLSQGICFLVMSLARSRVALFSSGASLPKVRLDGNA
jgi:hypothetical protein